MIKYLAILLAVGMSVFVISPASADEPQQCSNHPCDGLAYELVYWANDGKIVSLAAYDPCGPPYYDCSAKKPLTILQPGQEWMLINGDSRIADLMKDVAVYRVDPGTRTLQKIGGAAASASGSRTDLASLAQYILPAIGITAMVFVVANGVRRRHRLQP